MRKKKILIIVFILLCALTGISVGHYFWKESKKMTGVEWFAEQESYVKQMETYTDSMDDIMTLYLNGTITKDDFLNHLSVKQDELTAAVHPLNSPFFAKNPALYDFQIRMRKQMAQLNLEIVLRPFFPDKQGFPSCAPPKPGILGRPIPSSSNVFTRVASV